jgi:hypothetical protein
MECDELLSFWETMHRLVPESRNVHGLRHKQATVLTIVFAFLLSGGQGGHRSVAAFARDLSPTQRAAVRCWSNRKTRTYDAPTENCIYRVLKAVPVLEFQQAVWALQHARHGALDGSVVVLDGKALRGSGGTAWSGRSMPGADAPWASKGWPTRATRSPPGRRLAGPPGTRRSNCIDGRSAHPNPDRPEGRAGGRRGFRPLCQRQSTRPVKTSATLPSGRFFPLNCSRLKRATAESSGAASG